MSDFIQDGDVGSHFTVNRFKSASNLSVFCPGYRETLKYWIPENVSQVYFKNGWAWVKKTIIQRSQVGHNIYTTETWITHTNTKTKSVFIAL